MPRIGALTLTQSSKRQLTKLSSVPSLTPCAAKYFAALTSPWSEAANGACVPWGSARESQKLALINRFTMTTGSDGFGYVFIAPCLSNDSNFVFYTNSSTTAYTASPNPISAATTPFLSSGWGTALTTSPYATAKFYPPTNAAATIIEVPVQGRIVSCAASIQYLGSVSNMSGAYYLLADPSHSNLAQVGFSTSPGFGSFTETDVRRVTDQKEWLVDFARSETECDYPTLLDGTTALPTALSGKNYRCFPYSGSQPAGYANSADQYNACTMALAVTGCVGQSFQIEIITHVEFIGQAATYALTPNSHDVAGGKMVLEAVQKAVNYKANTGKDWLTASVASLKNIALEHGPSALRMGAAIMKSILA